MKLAERLAQVSPSLTLAIDARAKAMKAQGIDLCNFTVGEPDFETPEHIREAAKKALDQGKTKYGNTSGELRLREAIAKKLKAENGLEYGADHVVVTNGGKHSLYSTIMALVGPGDDVLIPAPYWLSYPEMVRLAGANPVFIPTTVDTRYKITAQMLRQSVTPKSKILVLNSPSNPTGMVYTRAEMETIAEVVLEKDLLVISDEIYEKLVYEGEHVSFGSLSPEIFQRTIVSNGFAKAYAMTGWRLGYVAGPLDIMKAVANIQSHSTSNVCTFAQYGAIAALEGEQACLESMRKTFLERRELMLSLIQAIPQLSCAKPDGAFYLFVDISKTGLKSLEFCSRLLDEAQVAAAPGLVFGDDKHIRFSYATDFETLRKGVQRLAKFVASL
jgi:aspartate aminotransferase